MTEENRSKRQKLRHARIKAIEANRMNIREEERGRERGTSHQAVMLSPKLRRLFTIEENVMHYFSNFIHRRSERERERERVFERVREREGETN